MPTDPCLESTDSILLEAVNTPRALKASLVVAPEAGNPLTVAADGVTAFDPWASDQGGVGVNDGPAFLVVQKVPPSLGVWVTALPVTSAIGRARPAAARLPGAGNARLASVEWPMEDASVPFDIQLPVADPSNPRVDRIVARWNTAGKVTFEPKPGTPSSGATLDNLTGAASIDETSELRLADVLVDAAAVSIGSTKIRDRRRFITDAGIYLPSSVASIAPLEPAGVSEDSVSLPVGTVDNHQSAVLVQLRRPITANYVYWRYMQFVSGVAISGTWAVSIFDVSRRLLLTTGPQNFATSSSTVVNRVRSAFTSIGTVLPAGYYYLHFGVGALTSVPTGGASIVMRGYGYTPSTGGPIAPNVFYNRATGSTNPPQTLDGALLDSYSNVASTTADVLPVPVVAIGEA